MDSTEIEVVNQFRQAFQPTGLDYAGDIIADGHLHRIKANSDRNPNSWYVLHPDDPAAGSFGCWKRGISESWCAKSTAELTETERAERDRKWQEAQAQRQAEERRRQEEAAAKAQTLLDAAQPAIPAHSYLSRKGVKSHPDVLQGDWKGRAGCLLIPLRDPSGRLGTIQAIFPERDERLGRDKDFLSGGRKRGCYFLIGDLSGADTLLIAEGYATAATLHEATGYPTVMAADAGNLQPVAEALRALYPDLHIIICADNDRHTDGNPGLTKARQAAKAIRADLVVPEFAESEAGTDFNDLAALHGLVAVQAALANPVPTSAEPISITDRPVTISLIPGELAEITDAAEAALCKYDHNLFQRSGQLVRWYISRPETVQGITRPGGAVALIAVEIEYLLDRMNRLISWSRWSSQKGDVVRCNAPRNVASALLARRGAWKAQPLVAAINAPTLRPDGSILDQPGYDAATGLLLIDHGILFKPIPVQPTRTQAQEALALLKEVIVDFPFTEDSDHSAALSALLTATIRHALKNAPMYTFSAPRMASGKSLLADVVALVGTGQPATVMSYTGNPEEMRKRVLTVLLSGDAVINLDNVEEPLQSQTLCSVLTQETFTDRILGTQRSATAPTACTWLATGNNLLVQGDLSTRIVPCNLDPQCERPEEREFSRNLHDWIPVNRTRLIQSALTVLRAYVVAGKPKQALKNFARFENWSGWVRSALVWLDEPDPLLGREQMEDADPVRDKLRAVMLAWYSVFKTAPATVKEIIRCAHETDLDEDRNERPCYPALYETLSDHFKDLRTGEISNRFMGEFLKQYARRVEQGARFEADGTSQNRMRWRIKIVDAAAFELALQKFSGEGESTHTTHTTHTTNEIFSPSGESRESGESLDPSCKNNRPVEVVPREPLNLTDDPAALWAVLKLYRGAEWTTALARKLGWGTERLMYAAMELREQGLAEINGEMVKPMKEGC
ncbi:MAG TPA: toprim domain-containing protein [Candidatus Competibacteraceae bacterium]|nr:toprim domain-containing protein [Candidatus Competibacteraceae bacterium]HSA45382.1 toprim domain-containing protein [Candidatus Competibacteraceae bacterium]